MTDPIRQAAEQARQTLEGWANYGNWVWPESALEQAKRNTAEALASLNAALAAEPQGEGPDTDDISKSSLSEFSDGEMPLR